VRLLAAADIALHLLHVGRSPPPLPAAWSKPLPPLMLRSGNVVRSIVDAAVEFDVDFIGMPKLPVIAACSMRCTAAPPSA
jgi:hypothetical protein